MCAHPQAAAYADPIVERKTLANLPSNLQSDAPPDGLQWGDGEPGSARRRSSSPDVKGVFGEGASVVAMTPPPPPAAGPAGLRTLAKLFLSEPPRRSVPPENDNQTRAAADPPIHANNIGVWSDAKPEAGVGKQGLTWQGVGRLPRAVIGQVAASLLPRPVPPPPASIATAPPASLLPRAHDVVSPASIEPPISDADSLELEKTPTGSELEARSAADESSAPSELSIDALPSARPKLRSAPAPIAAVVSKSPPSAAPEIKSQAPLDAPRVSRPRKSARRMAAADLLLGGGAIVLTVVALYLGGAYAKLWSLPPAIAALLNLEQSAPPSTSKLLPPTQPSAAEQALAKPPAPTPQAAALPPPAADAPVLAQPSAAAPATTDKPEPVTAEPPPSAADSPVLAPEQAAPPPAKEAPQQGTAEAPSSPTSEVETNGSTAVLSGDRLLLAAHHKLALDDLAGAEALARRAIAANADDHHAMEALVEVLIEETRGAEAVKYAVQIVRKRPKRVAYRMLEGDARLLAHDKVGAERAWREALALDPGNRDAKRRLGLPP